MKILLLLLTVALSYLPAHAQPGLVKLWESDTLTLKGPESALFDPKTNSLYISSMYSGSVVLMDLNGRVTNKEWIKGLNANKGSALFKGQFYTAETTGVAIIDVDKAVVVKRIPIEGAVMLNDLAVDSKGVVYVSDTRTGKVYRIEGDKPTLYLENLPGANGLLTLGSDLYVLTSTNIYKVNADKVQTKIGDDFESGLDGIVKVANDEFIISNYKGMLWRVKTDGTKQLLLDTRTSGTMSNDIGYDSATNTLFVPSFSSNRIIAYKVK